jgi:hypothetical protein
MALRRARGMLLRLARRPRAAIAGGVAIAAPAAWLTLGSHTDAWWIDGLSLILLATGIALIWTGLTGVSPDWLDDDER